MQAESVAEAFEREHHEIDECIAAFTAAPGDREPLTHAIRALRRHIYLEEEFLFPLLYQAQPELAAPLSVMLREHGQLWATLDVLEREPDPGTARATCKRLVTQLLHHNLKEEKVLYAEADALLPAAAAGRLRAFVGSVSLPEGWVCAKTRPAARHAPG